MEYRLYVTAERSVVRESVKGILWSIFFHRLFGPITPATNEFLSVTYSMADNLPVLDTLIDEKVNQLIKTHFDSNNQLPTTVKQGHVIVQFHDKKVGKSKKSGWFGKSESSDNLKLWESWIVAVTCLPIEDKYVSGSEETNPNIEASIKSFEDNLYKIIQIVDAHKEHIPPITSLESSPFPYTIDIHKEVRVSYETEVGDEWGRYIKNSE